MIPCPHCGEDATIQHLQNNPGCNAHIASLCGLRSLSMRKTVTRAGGRRFEPWDGTTNPHGADISTPAALRQFSKRKRCRKCKGPVPNKLKLRVCEACRIGM